MENNYKSFVQFLLAVNHMFGCKEVIIYLKCNEDDSVSISFFSKKPIGFTKDKTVTYNMEYLTSQESLRNIIINSPVAIDSLQIQYNVESAVVVDVLVNCPEYQESIESKGTYQYNKEISKIILSFDKDWYLSLPDEDKSKIKSNYLFSRKTGSWISRAKFPNLYYAERVAKELGLKKLDTEGEARTFEEQQNVKASKAEARAERYEKYAENAENRGKPYRLHYWV